VSLFAAAGRFLLSALGRTWRLEWQGEERLEAARRRSPSGNVIYAFWHSSIAILAFTHRRRQIQVLVSQHRDGERMARILEGMGYASARGSSRRGGAGALFALAGALEAGRDVAIAVDGPLGPRHHVHRGVLLLARRTGRPVVPVIPTARRCLCMRTWDALRLPWPGTRVRIQHGEPLWVGSEVGGEELAWHRHALERSLGDWTVREESRQGHRIDLRDLQDERGWIERASENPHPPALLRAAAAVHAAARRAERRLRPRPRGAGGRPWVVGVGNLEAGGTGKTPCIVVLAGALHGAGLGCAVLTRGHGGRLGRRQPAVVSGAEPPEASDETRLLAEALGPEIPIVVSADKLRGLDFVRRCFDFDVVLVDDALQTPRLPVDRHLVLLDWEEPLGNGYVLPAGRLREPPQALAAAAALLFTRARGAEMPRHPAWAHLQPGRTFLARESILGLRRPDGRWVDARGLGGSAVALLSGIGRPRAFERAAALLAAQHGFEIRRIVRIGDHAAIEPALGRLLDRLPAISCQHLVVTRKDLLRRKPPARNAEPLLVLEQRLEVDSLGRLLRILVPDAYCLSAKSAKLTDNDAGM
jgi:tetraacyldisaccharide 4'-kinase